MIRFAREDDAADIARIYNYYIEKTAVSFEEASVSEAEMRRRILQIRLRYPWIVWTEGASSESDPVLGYAYLDEFHERSAYRFTASDSIYVMNGLQRRGIGGALMARLMSEAGERGFHAVMALITSPNEASEALHAKFGFQRAGLFEELGFKFGSWHAVSYWEKLLPPSAPQAHF
jgi:phosphinothricin acetyltransferase